MVIVFKVIKKNGDGFKIVFIVEYDVFLGNGYVCGYYLIVFMGVGVGIVFLSILDIYKGEVSIIGIFVEEIGDGKFYLIEYGVFDGYDVVMMIYLNLKICVIFEIIVIGGLDFIFIGKVFYVGVKLYNGINVLDVVVLLYNNINVLR